MRKIEISLPYKYSCREYQKPFWRAMNIEKKLRAVLVWHRRSGKDLTLLNFVAVKTQERVGAYYYIFPTYNQGRKIFWEGVDKDGVKFLDHFPKELLKKKPNDTEMKLEFVNGSIVRVIGSDDIDSIVGTNPIGCVFSEYSLQDPKAWDFMRPILAENGGWAVFNFTPRGENHGYQLLEMAEDDPAWFTQVLTVDDTQAISQEVLNQERKEIIAKDGNDALYQQEYYCSFKVPIAGAYYAAQIMRATDDKRIGNIPIESTVPVDTYWDLGINDSTTIWFVQVVGKEVRLVDYYESSGEGLAHYAKVLQDKKYLYGRHVAPHDIAVRELSTGRSRREAAKEMGIDFDIAPRCKVEDGIEAGRNIFSRLWIDQTRCARGLNALKSYHKEYDEANKTYRTHPEHDWSSNGADAFRVLAVSFKDKVLRQDDSDGTESQSLCRRRR